MLFFKVNFCSFVGQCATSYESGSAAAEQRAVTAASLLATAWQTIGGTDSELQARLADLLQSSLLQADGKGLFSSEEAAETPAVPLSTWQVRLPRVGGISV